MDIRQHPFQPVTRGHFLQELRERRGYSREALIVWCNASGLPIGRSEYREIESGGRLPDDLIAFVRVVMAVLAPSTEELVTLLRDFAAAILCDTLGDDLAAWILSA
jgi:hypothetical protein